MCKCPTCGQAIKSVRAKPAIKVGELAFGDYPMACANNKVVWPSYSIQATFADGHTSTMSFASQVNKPINLGRAVRVVRAAYQNRKGDFVPQIRAAKLKRDGAIVATLDREQLAPFDAH